MPNSKNTSSYTTSEFTDEYLKEFAPAIRKGSVSFLSVVHPPLLQKIIMHPDIFFDGFGEESIAYYSKYSFLEQIKRAYFIYLLQQINSKGNTALIPQLTKGIRNRDDLDTYLKLARVHIERLCEDHTRQNLLIYPGTFDPMHYGHRLMIASLLNSLEPHTSLAVNVNSYQARKTHLEETYEQRFANLEYRILRSNILDPYRVCAMDFRFGAREDEDHLRQTRLQAFMAGDDRLRWVIGGDKFLSEIDREEKEEAEGVIGRTLSRFYLDNMSIYIVPRKGQDKDLLGDLATDFNKRYPAHFVCISEQEEYEGEPISSTLIRTFRSSESPHLSSQIKRMEKADLTRDYYAD